MQERIQTKVKDGDAIDLVPAILIGAALIVMTGILTIFNTGDDDLQAAIFPPWMPEEEAFRHVLTSNASIVRFGLNGHVIVVKPNGPGFADHIKQAGALAVINPLGFGACGTGAVINKKVQARHDPIALAR